MPERRKARREPRAGASSDAGGRSAPLARSIWSGSISFGLVTVPVELYAATRRAGLSLRMLGPEGTPLARQYVCPADGEVLSGDEIERGYEMADDEFVIVTDEELEQLAPRRSRDIALDRFVPRHAIDPAFFVRSYFLVPGGEQSKAYRLLAETMESTGRAAIASFVMRGRSYAVAIFADRGILRAETLRFGDELRSVTDVGLPEPGRVEGQRVKEMAKRIDALAARELDESELEDDQAETLLAIARRKRERGDDVVEAPEATAETEEAGAQVLDLMALLKQRMRGPSTTRSARRGAPSDTLEEATKQALYERARDLDIPGRSRMSRDELLASIRRAS